MSLCDIEEVKGEIEEAELTIARLIECKHRIEEVVNSNSSITAAVSDSASHSAVAAAVNTSHLPKLILPKFRGDVTRWTTFWDSYKSAVHKRTEISKVDKFNYLNSLVEGSAANGIQGLTLSEANYDSAVKLLKKRYGRPQQIITEHIDELMKIPTHASDLPLSLR